LLEVIVIAALLIVILGFMAWDRRAPALSKGEIGQHEFTPGMKLSWQVPFIAAGVFVTLAAAEFWALLSGSAPLWSSTRAAWQMLHSLLGPYTNLVPSLGMALCLFALGFGRLRLYKRRCVVSQRSAA
jgi:type IV secretory pathway VirB2 component (pilin)